ncbi:MAG: hypothetical protein Kow0042_29360 [Calditrichia bacterium]
MKQNCRTYIFLYILFFFVIIGGAYTVYLHFDYTTVPDMRSYMKMAEGNFQVNLIHRYRPIVPLLAKLVSLPISEVYTYLWPHRPESDWPLRLGFLIVNSSILALAALLIFRTCRAYGILPFTALLVVFFILISRCALYISGLPRVDSLYFLIFALTLYGLKVNSKPALIFSILVGPFAKESFIFLAPLIFFWGKIDKKIQIALFALAGALVLGMRYGIDQLVGTDQTENLSIAFLHLHNLSYTLFRIFSIRGIGELFSVFGVLYLILFIGFTGGKRERKKWTAYLDVPVNGLLIVVVLHMFLSGDIGRMSFLAAPALAVICGLILDRHSFFIPIKKFMGEKGNDQ